jgi:hypothetical protein
MWVNPIYRYTGQVAPRFGDSSSLEEWKLCNNLMVEANTHLRPLHISIFGISKVFEPLVCCLKGMWVHPYAVTLAKLAPDVGSQGHLRNENDAITSWQRLISISDYNIHPYKTYTQCLSHWYAVSRAKGCTLIPLHRSIGPQIWGIGFT